MLHEIQLYNQFAAEVMERANYEQVKEYATNEYFAKLNEERQKEIAGAYARIERNNATPFDVVLIIYYYSKAEESYMNKQR